MIALPLSPWQSVMGVGSAPGAPTGDSAPHEAVSSQGHLLATGSTYSSGLPAYFRLISARKLYRRY